MIKLRYLLITCIVAGVLSAAPVSQLPDGEVRDRPFDTNWCFLRADAPGAWEAAYDDASWRVLDVPHDWSIEDLPSSQDETSGAVGPFSRQSPGGASTGHVLGGIGWYRKHFVLSPEDTGKRVSIRFDGVYMDSEVWLNGRFLGRHPYGYTAFAFDLTPYVKPPGQTNVLAVCVRNVGANSRWYSGSGIYRHVWLTVTHPVHIPLWGVFVTTPRISAAAASVYLAIELTNTDLQAQDVTVSTRLMDPDGSCAATITSRQTVAAQAKTQIQQTTVLPSPQLWSLPAPHRYEAVTDVRIGGTVVDRVVTPFGIRTLAFSAQGGFKLNGQPVLLRGGCVHHDNGPLGAAAIDRAEVRRIELMKASGFNAIRTSHNPPSPAFLDACDRLGMLVIDELFDQWVKAKKPMDYHRFFSDWWQRDLAALVKRDRNRPSVIMWSIGNEIEERADEEGLAIARQLGKAVRGLDTSRPVTEAVCSFWEHPGRTWSDTIPTFARLDVAGYNYQWKHYESDHGAFPDRIMVGLESFPLEALANWQQVESHPYVIGDFVWTGMDYLGESAIGHSGLDNEPDSGLLPWPWYVAYCGDIDICGEKKPQSYYRDVVWRRSPLEMAVHVPIPPGRTEKVSRWGWPNEVRHWTWPGQEGKAMQVSVYTRYPQVRLELNGRPLGTQSVSEDTRLTATFTVPYEPGELRAVGLIDDQAVSSVTFVTAGRAAALRLTPDRATLAAQRNDLAYVTVEVVDQDGRVVPQGTKEVRFRVKGPGELAAVANADPRDLASFRQPVRRTYRGRALAILRPRAEAGIMTLTAEAEGLAPAVTSVLTQ